MPTKDLLSSDAKWFLGFILLMTISIFAWGFKKIDTHGERLTSAEARIEHVHESLEKIENKMDLLLKEVLEVRKELNDMKAGK